MSRSIDRVTTFHLGNRDEISHMNGLQNSSRLPSHPGNRDHMKRPLQLLFVNYAQALKKYFVSLC